MILVKCKRTNLVLDNESAKYDEYKPRYLAFPCFIAFIK